MKTKLTAGEITTAESLPHDEVITVSQDYTEKRLEKEDNDPNQANDMVDENGEMIEIKFEE